VIVAGLVEAGLVEAGAVRTGIVGVGVIGALITWAAVVGAWCSRSGGCIRCSGSIIYSLGPSRISSLFSRAGIYPPNRISHSSLRHGL
jgi:hypothetical protein